MPNDAVKVTAGYKLGRKGRVVRLQRGAELA